MELPEKQNNFLSIRQHNIRAIDKRRSMIEIPEVFQKLNSVEKYIFQASTKVLISEMKDSDLVKELAMAFKTIAKDVGYRITDQADWKFRQTRIYAFLKMHFSNLAVDEISLAFELIATGDLDEFLPKDKDGNPDKNYFNHYQEFNIDFFGKILRLYKQKQGAVISKATDLVPRIEFVPSEEYKNHSHNVTMNLCKMVFLRYKYLDILDLDGLKIMFVFDWLKSQKLISEPTPTQADRETAFERYLLEADLGKINRYSAAIVRKEGSQSKAIDFPAMELAKKKLIKRVFDAMIKNFVNIENYLNYKK